MPNTLIGRIIARVESGGLLPDAPYGSYANGMYQQFPGFVSQYGAGEAGVTNYAQQVLAANPNATVGDLYAGYFYSTGNPANIGANITFGGLASGSLPAAPGAGASQQIAAANNFFNGATAEGVSPSTPLASVLGGGSASSTSYSAGPDPLTADGGPGSTWQADQGLGSDTGSSMGFPAYNVDGSVGTPAGPNVALGPSSTFPGLGMSPSVAGGDAAPSDQTAAGGASGDGTGFAVTSANQAPFSDDITNIPVAGVNAPIGSGQINTSPPTDKTQSQAGQAPPVKIVGDLPNAITQSGNTVAKSATQLGQDIQQAQGAAAAAGTSWLGSIFTAGTSLFVRSGFVMLGLVLLLGAFMFFYAESKPGGATVA